MQWIMTFGDLWPMYMFGDVINNPLWLFLTNAILLLLFLTNAMFFGILEDPHLSRSKHQSVIVMQLNLQQYVLNIKSNVELDE